MSPLDVFICTIPTYEHYNLFVTSGRVQSVKLKRLIKSGREWLLNASERLREAIGNEWLRG